MNRIRRQHLLVGASIVVGVFLVLLFVGLRALESDAVRTKIAATMSSALGQPVQIGALSVSVLPAPALDAKQIRVGGKDSSAAPGVALARLHVAPRVLSLLPGRTPTIDRVDLDGLVISVRRTAAGKWLLPVPPVPVGAPPPTPGASPTAALAGGPKINLAALHARHGALRVVDDSLRMASGGPTVTTISDIEADLEAVNGTLAVSHFGGRLGHTNVTGSAHATPKGASLTLASPSISNDDLPALFALAGMRPYPGLAIGGVSAFDMAATIGGADLKSLAVTGKLAFGRVQLGTISMQDFKTPFRLAGGVVTLDPVAFTLYQGHELGTVVIDLHSDVPAYAIKTTLTGLDVNQALSANTTMKNVLLGTAQTSADVRASGVTQAAIQQSLTGTAKFAVTDGDVRNMPLLSKINSVLGLTEGSSNDTKFQSLTGSAVLGGGKATTNDVTLRAGELAVLVKGIFNFDQTLHLGMTAVLSPTEAHRMAKFAGITKPLENEKGEIEIPGTITGTATNPNIAVNVGSVAKREVSGIGKSIKSLFSH